MPGAVAYRRLCVPTAMDEHDSAAEHDEGGDHQHVETWHWRDVHQHRRIRVSGPAECAPALAADVHIEGNHEPILTNVLGVTVADAHPHADSERHEGREERHPEYRHHSICEAISQQIQLFQNPHDSDDAKHARDPKQLADIVEVLVHNDFKNFAIEISRIRLDNKVSHHPRAADANAILPERHSVEMHNQR